MEQIVRVRRVLPDGKAEIFIVRESACSGDCHKCSGCGAAKESILLTVDNPIGAITGDFVKIQSETGPVLKAAVVLYMLPLLLFFGGYALGAAIGWQPGLMGGIGFGLGVAFAVWFDRHTAKKNDTVYTITGYAPGQGHA